jgi:hypothetical protein
MQTEEGTAATENLRLAMLHYRALFSDLLGPPPQAPAATDASPPVTAPGPRRSS